MGSPGFDARNSEIENTYSLGWLRLGGTLELVLFSSLQREQSIPSRSDDIVGSGSGSGVGDWEATASFDSSPCSRSFSAETRLRAVLTSVLNKS